MRARVSDKNHTHTPPRAVHEFGMFIARVLFKLFCFFFQGEVLTGIIIGTYPHL